MTQCSHLTQATVTLQVKLTDGATYSKPRPTPHCRVLPPCKVNRMMPEPLLVYIESFTTDDNVAVVL